MSKYISVRVSSLDFKGAGGQAHHDLRSGFIPGYVDRERSGDNSVIVLPASAEELRTTCVLRRSTRETKRRMRSDAAVSTVGIITFSTEAHPVIASLSREDQDARFLDAAEAAAEAMGTTLSGLVVHRDEFAIHAHFQCPAYRLDGLPVARALGRDGASALQDVVAGSFDDLGITRGEKKAEKVDRLRAAGVREEEITAASVHRTVKQLHEDLPEEVERKAQELIALQAKIEKNERLIREQQLKLEDGRLDEETARKRVEVYERRVAVAKDAEAEVLARLDAAKQAAAEVVALHDRAKAGIASAISFSGNFSALGAAVDDLLANGAAGSDGKHVSGRSAIDFLLERPERLAQGGGKPSDERLARVVELARLTFPDQPEAALKLCVGDVTDRVKAYRRVVERELSLPNQEVAALNESERGSHVHVSLGKGQGQGRGG